MTRRLGLIGTVARVALGAWLLGDVALGHLRGDFHALPWVVGLVGFPALVLGAHWWISRSRGRLEATGPLAHLVHLGLICAILSLHMVPAFEFTFDALLVYYGATMLVAAGIGQSDCEVTALSNRLFGRDDRLGCLVFAPFDFVDRRLRRPSGVT